MKRRRFAADGSPTMDDDRYHQQARNGAEDAYRPDAVRTDVSESSDGNPIDAERRTRVKAAKNSQGFFGRGHHCSWLSSSSKAENLGAAAARPLSAPRARHPYDAFPGNCRR